MNEYDTLYNLNFNISDRSANEYEILRILTLINCEEFTEPNNQVILNSVIL